MSFFSSIFKGPPKPPDPGKLAQQQAEWNRIDQFTPHGDLRFGTVDANGNFVPREGGSASRVEQTPYQRSVQGLQEYAGLEMLKNLAAQASGGLQPLRAGNERPFEGAPLTGQSGLLSLINAITYGNGGGASARGRAGLPFMSGLDMVAQNSGGNAGQRITDVLNRYGAVNVADNPDVNRARPEIVGTGFGPTPTFGLGQQFNEQSYRDANPDLTAEALGAAGLDARQHYEQFGAGEKRDLGLRPGDRSTLDTMKSPEEQLQLATNLLRLPDGGYLDQYMNEVIAKGGYNPFQGLSEAQLTEALANQGGSGSTIQNEITQLYGDVNARAGESPTDALIRNQQSIEDAMYARAASRLDPQFRDQGRAVVQGLANRGVPLGYQGAGEFTGANAELERFDRGRNDAYTTAAQNAILAGGQEQSRMLGLMAALQGQDFNQGMQRATLANAARGQNFNENLAVRNSQLQELMSVLGGQPFQSQAPVPFFAPGNIDVVNPTMGAYQGELSNYQNNIDALFSLLGAGVSAYGGGKK